MKINVPNAPKPVGLYPHARRAGNLLFLSGIGPRDPASDGVPGLTRSPSGNYTEFDFEAQVRSVFQNVRIVLEASGSKWEDLVDVTVFLVDMERDFHSFNRLYAEYFKDNQPCRTTVGIDRLPTPIAIELKCIAVISEWLLQIRSKTMQADGFERGFHTLFLNFLTSIGFLHTFAPFTEYRNPKASHSYPAFFVRR